MRKLLLVSLFLVFLPVVASAGCIRCDQTTGYFCYMRSDGRYAQCETLSGGCATWGYCDPSAEQCEPPKKCPFQNNWGSVSLTGDYRLASVTVVSPRGTQHLTAQPMEAQRASR
jgi:hypothetical protein